MADGPDKQMEYVNNGLRKLLEIHGFAFQYAMLDVARAAYEKGPHRWMFEVGELPVRVQDQDTRADFILRKVGTKSYMVVECKRADPRRGQWCFVKAPYTRRGDPFGNAVIYEAVSLRKPGELAHISATGMQASTSNDVYHHACEVRNLDGGAEEGKLDSRGAIDHACAQVCRAMNGLVELVARDARWFTTGGTRFVFIPVVVTTATLWASNVELDKTEHTTGNLGDKDMGLTQKPWLYLQFPVSPGIKHARSPDQLPTELRDLLAVEYWRTIAIVNAASFAEYLACADVTDIFLDPVWTPPSR